MVTKTLFKYDFLTFLSSISYLFILPLYPAIPSQVEGKTEEGQHKQAPEEAVCDFEASVEDIRDPMDRRTLSKVLRCLEESYVSLVFFSHSGLSRTQDESRL